MGLIEVDEGTSAGFTLKNLRNHPAPKFVIAGGLTFFVDIGSLKLLHGVADVPLAPATIIAFAVAFIVNFATSRQWAFAATARGGHPRRQLARYVMLVAINLCSTVLIVVGFASVGVNYLVAKTVAASINATGNFFAYRHWVFAAPPVL